MALVEERRSNSNPSRSSMYILAPLGEEVAIHAQSGLALDWIIPPAMMSWNVEEAIQKIKNHPISNRRRTLRDADEWKNGGWTN